MIISFFAEVINTHEEDGVFTLGFSENATFDNYLTIQYQIAPLTEEEMKLGWTQDYLSLVPNRREVQFNLKSKGGNCDVTSVIILFSEQHTSIVKASLERIFASQILKTAT